MTTHDEFTGLGDDSLNLNLLAQQIQTHRKESSDLLDVFAGFLETAIPDKVEVTRDGSRLSRIKHVQELKVSFPKTGWSCKVAKNKDGTISAWSRGNEITMEECINDIMTLLQVQAANAKKTREALEKFVLRT